MNTNIGAAITIFFGFMLYQYSSQSNISKPNTSCASTVDYLNNTSESNNCSIFDNQNDTNEIFGYPDDIVSFEYSDAFTESPIFVLLILLGLVIVILCVKDPKHREQFINLFNQIIRNQNPINPITVNVRYSRKENESDEITPNIQYENLPKEKDEITPNIQYENLPKENISIDDVNNL